MSKKAAVGTKKAKAGGGAGQKAGGAISASRTPIHSIKVSKKGLVWVHVTLPRSVPLSVINLDAKTDSLHIDTGKVWKYCIPQSTHPNLFPPRLPRMHLPSFAQRWFWRINGASIPDPTKIRCE